MSKRFTKIICAILAAVVALGILLVAGCSEGHTDKALGGSGIFTTDDAESNGGFAVEKGNYIYFINGVQSNSANNEYGKPVKGAISRISKTDYENRNYSKTDIVVPQIAYSSNHDAGIFIYGDSVYYGTPSTVKNADGATQYQYLEMQSTKLDRSSTSAPYIRFENSSYEYRYVEVEGTVYLLYVATGEKLYGESSGVRNIHSLNTKTGTNTLLAYNVSSVIFDAEDKTNPQIYYTMPVWNNTNYNQVYTVRADATKAKEYDTSDLIGWDKKNDRYINCGDLVFDGIGKIDGIDGKTPFNFKPEEKDLVNKNASYTYTLKTYVNETLIFTRSDTNNSGQYLYTYKDGTVGSDDDHNPISINASEYGIEGKELLIDGSNADKYKYIFNEDKTLKAVLYAENNGITINYVYDDGGVKKLHDEIDSNAGSEYFNIVNGGTATLLMLDAENEYIYYSQSTNGINGYSVWRVSYQSNNVHDYTEGYWKPDPDAYSPVQVPGVDSVTDWYLPELIRGQLLYAAASSDMTLYPYVMVFDLRNADGDLMSNADLRDLKDLYDGIEKTISDFSDTEKYPLEKYQNLQQILRYGFFTADTEYIYKHQKKVNSGLGEDDNPVISDETLEEYKAFLKPTGEEDDKWKEYAVTKTVNGKEVYATNRNYYFSLLGKMTSGDKESYKNSFITYLPAYTEKTQTWWESIGTVGQVFFVIGMVLLGLIVIAGITILVIFLVKRKKKGEDAPKRRRIRVDTTDDKSIDVYNN